MAGLLFMPTHTVRCRLFTPNMPKKSDGGGLASSCAAAAVAIASAAVAYLHVDRASRARESALRQVLDYQTDGVVLLEGILKSELSNLSPEEFSGAVDRAKAAFISFTLLDMGCDPNNLMAAAGGHESLSLQSLVSCRESLVRRDGEDATPFINPVQYLHVHRHSEQIRTIAHSPALGRAAATLLRVPAVRLYQTAAFLKAPAHVASSSTDVERLASTSSPTAWHADLNQVPLDTNAFGTFWCPLGPVDRTQSLLSFAIGSHRDVSVRHWYKESSGLLQNESESERTQRNATAFLVRRHGAPVDFSPLALGDCTFHSGWMLHAAPRNRASVERRALTFSFVDASARLLANNTRGLALEDKLSWAEWVDDVYERGSTLDHPLLPLTYDSAAEGEASATTLSSRMPTPLSSVRDAAWPWAAAYAAADVFKDVGSGAGGVSGGAAPPESAESRGERQGAWRGRGRGRAIETFDHPGYLP